LRIHGKDPSAPMSPILIKHEESPLSASDKSVSKTTRFNRSTKSDNNIFKNDIDEFVRPKLVKLPKSDAAIMKADEKRGGFSIKKPPDNLHMPTTWVTETQMLKEFFPDVIEELVKALLQQLDDEPIAVCCWLLRRGWKITPKGSEWLQFVRSPIRVHYEADLKKFKNL